MTRRSKLEVWRHGSVGCAQAEGLGRREPTAEEGSGRVDARRGNAQRDAEKKLLTPRSRRLTVTWAIKDESHSHAVRAGRVTCEPKPIAMLQGDRTTHRSAIGCWNSLSSAFGYRRLHLLLRREGVMLNHIKLYRLYRQERLMVRKGGGHTWAIGRWAPMALPQ